MKEADYVTWEGMSKKERKTFVHTIISEVESQTEFEKRLRDVGCKECTILWAEVPPNDNRMLQAQIIFKELGRLIAKNGAVVSMTTNLGNF